MEQGIAKIIANMAELDDFFAKKDKKKGKSKAKFVTADELVKNLEEVKKLEVAANAVKPKKPDVSTAATTAATAGGVAEGGEKEIISKVPEPVPEVSAIVFVLHFPIGKDNNTYTYACTHTHTRMDSLLKRNGRNSNRSSVRIIAASRSVS